MRVSWNQTWACARHAVGRITNSASNSIQKKFAIWNPGEISELIATKAREAYETKEAEFPVMAGLIHFTTRDASGQKRYDRDQLVNWSRNRFHVDLDLDDLKNKQQDEIRSVLVEHSRANLGQISETHRQIEQLVSAVFADAASDHAERNGARLRCGRFWAQLGKTIHRFNRSSKNSNRTIRIFRPSKSGVGIKNICRCGERWRSTDHFRPEMRRLERNLVLQILDGAWKDHLLAMDHLRSSVSLRGYAQVDPKVEYKREGMQTFETMWANIGDRVTDLIFRMEQLDEGFVGSTWKETAAVHEEALPPTAIGQQQQSAIDNTQGDKKIEPIRNKQERVGRNDPCPCGSGKKYKNCCMRKQGGQAA